MTKEPGASDSQTDDSLRAVLHRSSGELAAGIFAISTSMFGFGALAAGSGFPLDIAVLSTLLIWAMPGQVAMVDIDATGGGLFAVFAAVALANARFLPMAVSCMVMLRGGRAPRWFDYLYGHLMSITSWTQVLVARDRFAPPALRLYFVTLALGAYAAALLFTALGYLAYERLPRELAIALAFVPALYILLMTCAARSRLGILAAIGGAVGVPLAEAVLPGWGLVVGGVFGGTLGYGAFRLWRSHPA